MENNDSSVVKEIVSFQDYNRYLSFFSFICTPGNHGLAYPSSFHAFMSYMTDSKTEALSLFLLGPKDVERLTKKDFTEPNEGNWDKKQCIMRQVQENKFLSNPKFAKLLIELPEEVVLLNRNTHHDNYWGDCICNNLPGCREKGKNTLGNILMEVKQTITPVMQELNVKSAFPRIGKMIEDRDKRYGI